MKIAFIYIRDTPHFEKMDTKVIEFKMALSIKLYVSVENGSKSGK